MSKMVVSPSGAADINSPEDKNREFIYVGVTKYFIMLSGPGPLAEINNRAVEISIRGQYTQAEILFKEAVKENGTIAALYNNLGIVYEAMNKRKSAFTMYTKACMMEPGNDYYRRNFLSFEECKGEMVHHR